MPTYEWVIHGTNNAKLGMTVFQSGRYLSVTMYRNRNFGATYYDTSNKNASITVAVNGGSSQGGVSASNAFPTSLQVGTWYKAALSSVSFDLGYGVANAHIVIAWDYPTGGWASGSTSYNVSVSPFYDAPAAPTSVVATRTSDTLTGLAWETNTTAAAPYMSQELYRSENGGDPIDTAALSGSATSYNAVTVANRKYTFTVQARNSADSTDSAASNIILTTPAKLASLTGAKVSGGIKLTFSKLDVRYTEAQVFLENSTNGGNSWSTVHTFDVADMSTAVSTDWTDTSAPTGGTVQYRATVSTNGGSQGVLSSVATVSNILILNVPPLAPTNLTPSGTVDVAVPVVLAWSHTQSSDGAAQSSRQIQYSTDSGSTQTDIVVGNSTAGTYSWTVGTGSFTAGQTVQWRVRTAGSQPGTYGAWSVWQTLTLRKSLTVGVTSPSGVWSGGDIPVVWTATPSWGSASQVVYRIVLTPTSGTAYDSGTVTSASLTGTIPAAKQQNLTDYTITVTVTDNYGLTSLPDSTTISTDFLAPGPVDMVWVYDDDLGQLVFTPTFDPETSSALDDTTSWMLERSFDNSTWEIIGTYGGDSPVPDPLVKVGAKSWYRTTGYTNLGVAGEQTVFEIPAADVRSKWGRISFGENFETTIRYGWSQTVEMSSGRASDVYDIEGVDYPVAVFGQQKSQKYAVSGKLLYKQSPNAAGIVDSLTTSSVDDFRALGNGAGVCLFRDPDGAWWNARATDVKTVRTGPHRSGQPDEAAVSFTIERVTL